MLVAALAAVGLYLGWTAWQRPVSIETTPKAPLGHVPEVAATPAALDPLQPTAVEAATPVDRVRTDDCLVRIVGHGHTLEGAVLGILDAATGAHLIKRQLPRQSLPFEVRLLKVPAGEHWAVLARNDTELRFAYLDRARLKRRAGAGGRRTALLRGEVYDLTVHLEKQDDDAICDRVPVLLRRPDDPDWRYRVPQGNDDSTWLLVTDSTGTIRLRQLGAGRYRLHVEGFEFAGSTPEWLSIPLDTNRTLRLTGSAR
jgi:hypothetical protein